MARQECDCNTTVVGSIPTRGNYLFLYFHFFALAPRQKLGVETYFKPGFAMYSTHNASTNLAESGERSVLTLHPALSGIQRKADLDIYFFK